MRFQIHARGSIGESIRHLACAEIDVAIAACSTEGDGRDSPVHQTRKHLKAARAALHLLSRNVPRKALRCEDRRLRDVGRLISNIRDAEVRLATINDLRKVVGLGRDRNLEETEGLLAFELDSFLAAFAGWEGEAVDKLRRAQTGMGEWDLEDVAPSSILRSLRSSYKKGRAALADVRRRGSTRRFHKLRQRSKELWLQLRLLRPVAPETVRELSRELKKLGEDLGHAHDLCFVAQRLRDLAGMHPRQRNRKMLTSLIESREQDLQRKAVRIAQRFYERKPKKFTNRLRKSFKGWKQPNESNLSHNGAMVNASAAV